MPTTISPTDMIAWAGGLHPHEAGFGTGIGAEKFPQHQDPLQRPGIAAVVGKTVRALKRWRTLRSSELTSGQRFSPKRIWARQGLRNLDKQIGNVAMRVPWSRVATSRPTLKRKSSTCSTEP